MCSNHILSETPPPPTKRYISTIFERNPHENNKNQSKKVKSVWKNADFQRPPLSPQKVYGLYICENVDIYGRPLTEL